MYTGSNRDHSAHILTDSDLDQELPAPDVLPNFCLCRGAGARGLDPAKAAGAAGSHQRAYARAAHY